MIVFRPFKGETILGKISSATPEGIHSMLFPLSFGNRSPPSTFSGLLESGRKSYLLTSSPACPVRTEFFEEIFVPYKELPENTEL